MKGAILFCALLTAASAACAGELVLDLNTSAPRRRFFANGVIPVGYAADPQPGGEEAALRCRRAGAWIFRTSACDDATLAFAAEYGLRIYLVVPDGDIKEVVGTLTRVLSGKYARVLAGVQLGTDPTGGEDLAKWRAAAAAVARSNLKCPVALPVKDFDSPFLKRMTGYLGSVTHLAVDLRDTPAPFEKLKRLASRVQQSPDAGIRRLRLWAVAPDRLPSVSDAGALAPGAVAWQMHWFMTAFAVDRTDAVFFDRPYRADDFGLALRHLWATTARTQNLVGCGESAAIVRASTPEAKAKRTATEDELALDGAEGLNAEGLAAVMTDGMDLTACAKVADGEVGDLQYMALIADPDHGEDGSGRMCLLLVNTGAEKVRVKVKLNTKYGGSGEGFRRRFVPDAKSGKMADSVRERLGGVSETVEPGEVTFLSFRI